MSMNKRLLAVALMFSLFMSLAACSNQESPSNGTPESGAKGEVSDTSVEYNEDEFLPIGSVVLLEGGNKRIMICGRIQAQAGSDIIYDYSRLFTIQKELLIRNLCFSLTETLSKQCIFVAMRTRMN